MPRRPSTVPSYRLHKASGQAIVTLSGQMIYLGLYGTQVSKQEYDRVVGEWLANHRLPAEDPAATSLTVVRLAAAYWKHAKIYYRRDGVPTSSLTRIRVAIRLLRKSYGETSILDFGPLALRALQEQLIASQKSRRYINYLVDQIRRIFKWGVSQQLVPVAVHQALATVPGLRRGRTEAKEASPIGPVAEDVVEKTLPYLPPVVAGMVRFQRLTGCRPGEVCLLRPCDIDTSGPIWSYRPARHKTEYAGKNRVISIGPRAQAILLPYMSSGADAYCFSPQATVQQRLALRRAQRTTPLQRGNRPGSNRKGKPARQAGCKYTTSSYLRSVTRACEIAFEMPPHLRTVNRRLPADERHTLFRQAAAWRAQHCWTPNQLRHSAATEIRRHFGLEAARVTLGHAHADVTQVYAERDHNLANSVMEKLG